MELIGYRSVEEKKKLLTGFNPEDSLWIVSDIKSHAFVLEQIQKNKVKKPLKEEAKPLQTKNPNATKPQYAEQAVWRAPDFWKKNLLIARPEITVLSRSLLTFIYQEWAKDRPLEWQRGWETGSVLCQYMEMVAHLLEHPLKESLITEWQSEKKGAKHLSKWQTLSQEFWEYLNPHVEGKQRDGDKTYETPNQQSVNKTLPFSSPKKTIIEESWVSAFLIDKFPFSHFKLSQTGYEKAEPVGQTLPASLGGALKKSIPSKENLGHEFLNKINMVFDLGFEMDQIEAELITQIAKKIKTKVLVPSHQKEELKEKALPPNYKTFLLQGASFTTFKKKAQNPPKIEIKKWTTPLAEVKEVSAYVGELLKKGVPAHKISVIAPRIEDYWLSLKSHFKKENIPINKSETSQLISFYESQLWLSTMYAHLSVIQYESMEALFAKQNPYQNFSQLKSEFYNVQERKHYPQHLYKKHLLKDKNQVVKISEFVKWALALLPENNKESPHFLNQTGTGRVSPFEKGATLEGFSTSTQKQPSTLELLKKSLNKFTGDLSGVSFKPVEKKQSNSLSTVNYKLPYSSWLKLLENFLKFKEITIKKEEKGGVNCLSFNALSYLESDFLCILGLSEQGLKTGPLAILSSSEADFLTQDLGFFVKYEPLDKMEQLVSHFIKQPHQEITLSFATSDFEGLPVSPSFFWLKKAKEQGFDIKLFSRPQKTQWDKRQQEIKQVLNQDTLKQKGHTLKPLNWGLNKNNINIDRLFLIQQAIKEDQGKKDKPPFVNNKINKLTVSLLEDYTDCPFIFLAKKHFGLWDGTDKNMDMSPLERGILIHKLFEDIVLELKKGKDITKSFLSEKLEKLWEEQNQTGNPTRELNKISLHPLIWEKEKSRLLKKAWRFLEKEQENKKWFKDFEPLACEKKYKCHWDLTKKSFAKTGDIAFEGKIDRIDFNRGGDGASSNPAYHIIDYKGQLRAGSNATSWLTLERFQMAVYAQVVEQGLADLPAYPVLSALYLSYKDFKAQGLALKEPPYIQFLGGPKKRSLISAEQKADLFKKINQQIQKVILNMQAGHFSAKPKLKKLCETCRWQKMCRAPHLN